MAQKTALIVGATGLVGGLLLNRLLESNTYSQVIVFGRRSTGREHPKLVEHIVDFNILPDIDAYVDDVFCCLGTTIKAAGSQDAFYQIDCAYPLNVAEWVKKNGAKQFVLVSAMGASTKSTVFYNRVKGEVEQKIAALDLPTVVICRPSLLVGERVEHRVGERIALFLRPVFNLLLIGSLKKYRPIEATQVARALDVLAQNNYSGVHIFESDALQYI